MENKWYYIYKITLLCGKLANHYYYGMHKRNSLDIDPMDDKYYGSGKIVNNYYEKYPFEQGVTAIKEIIEYNDTKKKNAEREDYYIGDKWLTDPLCLNLKAGGIGGGGKWTEEARAKHIAHLIGRPCTDEAKAKISKSNTGKKRTAEARAKMSAAKKGKPQPNLRGRTITEEQREKLRKANTGKKHTEEWKKNMSAKMKGRPGVSPSAETRAKQSAAKKGKRRGKENVNSIPVLMIDKDSGVVIKEFESMHLAGEYLGDYRKCSNICNCIKGRAKTAFGYMWEYKKVG